MPEAENALHQAERASHVRLTLTGHTEAVVSVAFSPDSVRLASANEDGMLRRYPAILEELMALAGSRLTRSWSLDECQTYLHRDSCLLSP